MCLRPIPLSSEYDVPCGKCSLCLKRRASGWSFRLMQEDRNAVTSYFITLTYNCDTLPISKRRFKNLDRKAVPSFIKRLRKLQSTDARGRAILRPIKYYAVGEYGGITKRPHYHLIIFNACMELMEKAWSMFDNRTKVRLPIGNIFYGTVTGASVGYCLKYMTKEPTVPAHRNDDRVPEFSLMSKGLGLCYLTPAVLRWHREDLHNRMYCTTLDGIKLSMPRYYKNRIYSPEEREIVGYHSLINMRKREEELLQRLRVNDISERYYQRLQCVNADFKLMFNRAELKRTKI